MPVIRVIPIPAKPIADMKKVQAEIQKALDDTGKELQRWFNNTVQFWDSAPTFKVETKVEHNRAWVSCFPDGDEQDVQKWARLDVGTERHDITPHGNYPLRFPWQGKGRSYLAHTTPGQLVSHPGGTKLGPVQSMYIVDHPGTEARRWSEVLADQEEAPFRDRIIDAIDRGIA